MPARDAHGLAAATELQVPLVSGEADAIDLPLERSSEGRLTHSEVPRCAVAIRRAPKSRTLSDHGDRNRVGPECAITPIAAH